MSRSVLILRPEPGASTSAARARQLGLTPIVAPLFSIRPLAWRAPDPAGYGAVLLTSANAARQAGPALQPFTRLPCYAVGPATAEAAQAAGFETVKTGRADGAAAAAALAGDGIARALHPCGRDHVELEAPGLILDPVPVYSAEPVDALPQAAAQALAAGALILVHSPRAGSVLASLVPNRSGLRLAAISAAAARAAGEGWRSKSIAAEPRDEALLELAAKLCQTGLDGVSERVDDDRA